MTATQTTNQPAPPPNAVVWIDERHAILAESETGGSIRTVEVRRAARPEPRYLADVVHELGDHDRIMVVGDGPIRIALEREFVAISHRPERLVPAPRATEQGSPELIARLERATA